MLQDKRRGSALQDWQEPPLLWLVILQSAQQPFHITLLQVVPDARKIAWSC